MNETELLHFLANDYSSDNDLTDDDSDFLGGSESDKTEIDE